MLIRRRTSRISGTPVSGSITRVLSGAGEADDLAVVVGIGDGGPGVRRDEALAPDRDVEGGDGGRVGRNRPANAGYSGTSHSGNQRLRSASTGRSRS